MTRLLCIVACGLSLAACSVSMPNWSFLGGGTPPPPPQPTALRLESDPPGAEAKASFGASCVTPCEVPLSGARGNFEITMMREGYLPQTVPVQVVRAEASGAGGPQFSPNPVFAKLEPTVQPKKKKARKKVADKPKPVAEAKAAPAAEARLAPAAVQTTPWLPPRW